MDRETKADARIDRLADEFEDALRAGAVPRIEDYLRRVAPALQADALRELIRVELELQFAKHPVADLNAYLGRFPGFETAVKDAYQPFSDVVVAANGDDLTRSATGPPVHDGNTRRRITSDSGSGLLEVRCPNCHTPTNVSSDTTLTDLVCSGCGSHFSLVNQSQATHMAPALTKLGRFELIERLGLGGFGTVWKARDKQLDRTVAIKIPREGAMTSEEQEKFFREARTAAQLRHPNIVSVHEVGRDGSSVYIVSDFVRGVTLGDSLTGQKLTTREAAELCAQIADALEHAHNQGVVHRDLKPANIMLDYDGRPHLMDFGLARRETGEATMTMDGQVLGTPAYMSPEQAEGESHKADRRSDVYSMGVILFQLLTGELPFRGNVRMLIKQVIHDDPPSPRTLNANVSRDLETITLKCLEKSPAKRYPTAREFGEELRRFLRGEPIRARPVGRIERATRWVRRNPWLATASSIAVTALLFGAIVSSFFAFAAKREATKAQSAKDIAETAKTSAETVAAKHRALSYASSMNTAATAWQAGMMPQVIRTLAAQIPKSNEPDLRTFEWYHLWDKTRLYRSCSMIHATQVVLNTKYSPDRNWIGAALGPEGSNRLKDCVAIWDSKTLQLCHCLHIGNATAEFAFFADGSAVANVGSDGRAYVWKISSEQQCSLVIEHREEKIVKISIAHDDNRICTATSRGKIRTWDCNTGDVVGEFAGQDSAIHSLVFSPSGSLLAASSNAHTIVWDARTAKELCRLNIHSHELCFDPTEDVLAIGLGETIHLYRISTGKEIAKYSCNAGVSSMAWSHDGRTIAVGGRGTVAGEEYTGLVTLLDAQTGEQLTSFRGHEGRVLGLDFAKDDRTLVSCAWDGWVIQWKLPETYRRGAINAGREGAFAISSDFSSWACGNANGSITISGVEQPTSRISLDGHTNGIWNVSFLNNRNALASIGGDKALKVWDLERHKLHARRSDPEIHLLLATSPDGDSIAYCHGPSTIKIVDSIGLTDKVELSGHRAPIVQLRFSSNGRKLASIARDTDEAGGEFILWDIATGQQLLRHDEESSGIFCVDISPDDKVIALGLKENVILLQNSKNAPIARLIGHMGLPVTGLAFSPDGKTLAFGSAQEVHFWDPITVTKTGAFRSIGRPGLSDITFDSSGATALATSYYGITELFRAPKSDVANVMRESDNEEVFLPRSIDIPDVVVEGLLSSARRSLRGLERAIRLSRELPPRGIGRPSAMLCVGEWAILGGDSMRGSNILHYAIEGGGQTPEFYKSYGWALLTAGRRDDAMQAFRKAIGDKNSSYANMDELVSAYFLDRINEEDFLSSASRFHRQKSAWFFIGQRRALEGARAQAINAYRTAAADVQHSVITSADEFWPQYCLSRLKVAEETLGEKTN